jgi:hypothetical protein
MKAVGYKKPLPITEPDSLLDIEVPVPKAACRDLLVEVRVVKAATESTMPDRLSATARTPNVAAK